jgi:hypothetical protein
MTEIGVNEQFVIGYRNIYDYRRINNTKVNTRYEWKNECLHNDQKDAVINLFGGW